MIVPAKDTAFLKSINLANVDLESESILNILFLAQDKRGPGSRARLTTVRDGNEVTSGLTSRSDIINVISLNKLTGNWTIFAFYRGMNTPAACGGSLGAEENYLTNYYSEYQRRYFIPCIELIMSAALRKPQISQLYGNNLKAFRIHALVEGTKEDTLDGLAGAIVKTALTNSAKLTYLYGYNGFRSALSMIANKNDLKKVMEGDSQGQVRIDTDYMYIEAKEREIYAAGGYQRSFNFARLLADALGWMGYGIYFDQNLPNMFAGIFDRYLSRTFSLSEFSRAITVNGKNLLVRAAYRGQASPVTIVQFGPGLGSFSVFQNGQFQHFGGNGHLRQLNPKIQILTPPASLPASANLE